MITQGIDYEGISLFAIVAYVVVLAKVPEFAVLSVLLGCLTAICWMHTRCSCGQLMICMALGCGEPGGSL